MAKHQLSKATYARLEAEIAHLEHEVLPEVADKIGRAREMGDRKNLLISILAESELATTPPAGEIGVLSRVTILFDGDDEDDAETYLIGHVEEKRTEQGIEVMSPVSPIGSALLGHKEGDLVSITLENGAKISVTVMKVAN